MQSKGLMFPGLMLTLSMACHSQSTLTPDTATAFSLPAIRQNSIEPAYNCSGLDNPGEAYCAFSAAGDNFVEVVEQANQSGCTCTIYFSGHLKLGRSVPVVNHRLIGSRDYQLGFQSDVDTPDTEEDYSGLSGLPVLTSKDPTGQERLELYGDASVEEMVTIVQTRHPLIHVPKDGGTKSIQNVHIIPRERSERRPEVLSIDKYIIKAMDNEGKSQKKGTGRGADDSSSTTRDNSASALTRSDSGSKDSSGSYGGGGGKRPQNPNEKDGDKGRDADVRSLKNEHKAKEQATAGEASAVTASSESDKPVLKQKDSKSKRLSSIFGGRKGSKKGGKAASRDQDAEPDQATGTLLLDQGFAKAKSQLEGFSEQDPDLTQRVNDLADGINELSERYVVPTGPQAASQVQQQEQPMPSITEEGEGELESVALIDVSGPEPQSQTDLDPLEQEVSLSIGSGEAVSISGSQGEGASHSPQSGTFVQSESARERAGSRGAFLETFPFHPKDDDMGTDL